VAYRRLKTNKEENLTKHVGFVYANVKKAEQIGKVMMRKVATSIKSKTRTWQWKTKPISVCECL